MARRPLAVLIVMLGLAPAAASHAAVLHITAAVTEITDLHSTSGNITDPAAINAVLEGASAHDLKITYYIHVDGLTGDEVGFGTLGMNINIPTGSFTRSTVPAHQIYLPSNATANEFGTPGSPIFSFDADQGTSPYDLQGIGVAIGSGLDPADGSADDGVRNYRLAAINDGYVPIGSFWVSYDGGPRTLLSPDITQWSVAVGTPTALAVMGTTGIDLSRAYIASGYTPEPSALGLLGAIILPLLARRRT